MGKQGPCYHCGITTTPLWRNGPPDKPVLCNACGSRWRTKGTLVNYMPMHSGGFGGGIEGSSDVRYHRGQKASFRPSEKSTRKRKEPCDTFLDLETGYSSKAVLAMSRSYEDDVSNISSLGSEISTFDGPTSFDTYKACYSEINDSALGCPWETPVPSRKRTSMFRARASSEKITRNLLAFEEPEVSSVTCPSSDGLLMDCKPPLMAVEIGLGSVLIRQPVALEPESEATSHHFDNKEYEAYGVRRMPSRGKEKTKQVMKHPEAGGMPFDNANAKNVPLENFPYKHQDVLQNFRSPLPFVEMKDLVNYDTFTSLLSEHEQEQLLNIVSTADRANCPQSLKQMFGCQQFDSAMTNYQQLQAQGMFDPLVLGQYPHVFQHFQQVLNSTNLTASGWMERNVQFQHCNKSSGPTVSLKSKDITKGRTRIPSTLPLDSATPFHHSGMGDSRIQASQYRGLAQNPQPYYEGSASYLNTFGNVESGSTSHGFTTGYHDAPLITSSSVSFSPPEQCSSVGFAYSGNLADESVASDGEAGLLLDIPSNMSFEQSKLLQQPSWNKNACFTDDSDQGDVESGSLIISNTWHLDNTAEWNGLIWNPSSAGQVRYLPNGTVLNP